MSAVALESPFIMRKTPLPICKTTKEQLVILQMSRIMTKPTKWNVHPAKTHISIHPVWSVFAVRSMGNLGPKLSSCRQKRLFRLGGCPGWSIFPGRICHCVGFVVWRLKCASAATQYRQRLLTDSRSGSQYCMSEQRWLWPDSADVQAFLRFCCQYVQHIIAGNKACLVMPNSGPEWWIYLFTLKQP